MQVTIFPKLLDPAKYQYASVEEVLQGIRDGGKLKQKVEDLRALALIDPDKANDEKKKLPVICWGGLFNKRANAGLVKASGLMVLDFDKVPLDFSEKLEADPFIWAYFLSPRGEGYKALVKIPVVESDADFKRYFITFQKRMPEVDESGKDIARACYFSYDPHLVVKETSRMWEEAEGPAPAKAPQVSRTGTKTDWSKISIGTKMLQHAMAGDRHGVILKAGKLMGGYIGNGSVQEADVLRSFEGEVMDLMDNPRDFDAQWKTFLNGVEYGKADPIKGIAEGKSEKSIGEIHWSLQGEVWDQVLKNYRDGRPKAWDIGFECLRKFYKVVPGGWSVLYGSPYSGKTQFHFEQLINLSTFYGQRHCIFSPETGRKEEVFQELIQMVAKGDFHNDYGRQIPEHALTVAAEFIKNHFVVIDADDLEDGLTPGELFDYVDSLERRFEIKIDTLTIDPWNELEHLFENEVQYLSKMLRMVRRRSKKSNRHTFIIHHVTDQKPIKVNGESVYPIPSPRDLAGGQTWYRKGMFMLAFWRHLRYGPTEEYYQLFGRTLMHNSTIIQIQKAKPKGYGTLGEAEVFYDAKTHRYYERGGLYARQLMDEVFVQPVQANFLTDDPNAVPF